VVAAKYDALKVTAPYSASPGSLLLLHITKAFKYVLTAFSEWGTLGILDITLAPSAQALQPDYLLQWDSTRTFRHTRDIF
jgi:hypothetical protein